MKLHNPSSDTWIRLDLNRMHVVEEAPAYVCYVDDRDDKLEQLHHRSLILF
jgi:hypothetical protein